MKLKMHRERLRFVGIFVVALLLARPVSAAEYVVSVPDYQANAGQTLRVPVDVSEAAGLSRIRLQVNYDNQVAALTSVSAGPLGENYDISTQMGDGTVTIDGVRGSDLPSGSGVFVWLDFLLNPGATTDIYTDLAVAQFEGGDETGVADLSVSNNFSIENGSIALTVNQEIDNSGNGIPDWWETEKGLDPYKALADGDEDADGVSNFMEYAQGGHPKVNDASTLKPYQQMNESNYFEFTFRRRQSDGQLIYTVRESTDLNGWSAVDLGVRMVGAPTFIGDDIEEVTVRSQHPVGAEESPESLFMRLDVTRN